MTQQLSLFSSYGPNAGSTRVRALEWISWLGADSRNHFFTEEPSNSLRALLSSPVSVLKAQAGLLWATPRLAGSTVLVTRRATPIGNGRVEERLLGAAGRGVYDFDDAVFMPTAGAKRLLLDSPLAWRRMVEAADTVIAGNEYLADQASEFSDSVRMIPSCVNPNDYSPKDDFGSRSAPAAVWIGSPSTERYLAAIAMPLLRAHQRHGLELLVVSGPGDLGPLEQMVKRVPWSLNAFAATLSRADFGLMPLPDNRWTRGKCAYKLLQYGASGLPMIGSPVGANRSVLEGCDGLSPETESDWSEALDQLATESATRLRERGATGLRFVSDNYSFNAWEPAWREAVLPSSP